jgi:hypothetical protein
MGGFTRISHSVSGDDDLFLQLVRRETSWGIRYAAERSTHVKSRLANRLGAWSAQQQRHVSAARFYPFGYKALGAGLYLYFLLLLAGAVAVVGGWLPSHYLFISLGIKFLTEAVILIRASQLFKSWSGWWLAPVLSVAYIFYILVFSLTGMVGGVKWKG